MARRERAKGKEGGGGGREGTGRIVQGLMGHAECRRESQEGLRARSGTHAVGAEAAALTIAELAGGGGSKALEGFLGQPLSSAGASTPHSWPLVQDRTGGGGQRRSGAGGSLTARSQGQASGTASDEVVEGVVGLLSDLGTDAGGEAKYGSDGGCRGGSGGAGAESGPRGQRQEGPQGEAKAPLPAVNVYRPVLATPSRKESGGCSVTL